MSERERESKRERDWVREEASERERDRERERERARERVSVQNVQKSAECPKKDKRKTKTHRTHKSI